MANPNLLGVLDEIYAALATVTIANGYNTDAGNNTFEFLEDVISALSNSSAPGETIDSFPCLVAEHSGNFERARRTSMTGLDIQAAGTITLDVYGITIRPVAGATVRAIGYPLLYDIWRALNFPQTSAAYSLAPVGDFEVALVGENATLIQVFQSYEFSITETFGRSPV